MKLLRLLLVLTVTGWTGVLASCSGPPNENDRSVQTDLEASEALDQGRTAAVTAYAKRLLAKNTDRSSWNYGNVIYDANELLGQAALREGRIEDAKKYLLEAGNTPGSPQLDSFGPDNTLARELLQRGEKKVVLEYLDLVARFWTHTSESELKSLTPEQRRSTEELDAANADNIKQWKAEIRAGKIPDQWR